MRRNLCRHRRQARGRLGRRRAKAGIERAPAPFGSTNRLPNRRRRIWSGAASSANGAAAETRRKSRPGGAATRLSRGAAERRLGELGLHEQRVHVSLDAQRGRAMDLRFDRTGRCRNVGAARLDGFAERQRTGSHHGGQHRHGCILGNAVECIVSRRRIAGYHGKRRLQRRQILRLAACRLARTHVVCAASRISPDVGGLGCAGIAKACSLAGDVFWLVLAAVELLLFPILLLAALEADSIFWPISRPIFESLVRVWYGWGVFYVLSGLLLAGCGLLTVQVFKYSELMTPLIAGPILAAAIFIYGRLLGRLTWLILNKTDPTRQRRNPLR